jgi:hypothetical protein
MGAVDYSFSRPNLDQLWDAGIRAVSRYLSWLPNGKVIQPAEAQALLAHGFGIALNWEYDIHDCLGGAPLGRVHAKEAVRQAYNLGYPLGKTIYFSCDFDASESQQPTINAYIRAAGEVVKAAGYRIGIYGDYWVVKRLMDANLIDDAWQAYAWSGGLWDARAHLRQTRNGVHLAGADLDLDQITGETYFWNQTQTAAPTVSVPVEEGEEDMLFAFKELSKETVYVSDGFRYRGLADFNAFKNLIDSGVLRKPSTTYSQVDGTGYAVVVGDGLRDAVGGVLI